MHEVAPRAAKVFVTDPGWHSVHVATAGNNEKE
eukprot:COSAG02_NODE_44326_length_367_cov_0.772388_1_plen_32_part_10